MPTRPTNPRTGPPDPPTTGTVRGRDPGANPPPSTVTVPGGDMGGDYSSVPTPDPNNPARGEIARVPPRRGRRGVVPWRRDDKPPAYRPRAPRSPSPRATQNAGREGRDRQLTFTDSEGRCVPLVYGLVRCGARIVYARTDSNQRYTYIVYLICEGPVNSISGITIDGHTPEQLGLVLNTSYKVYLGTSSQTVDTIINGFDPNWVSGHPGSAYVTMKLDGANSFAGRVNLEAFQATVEGALVRDPRTDGTLVNRYYRKSVTLAHADFLTNRRYGPGLPDAAVKFSGSITESANDDDANVSSRPTAPASAPTVAATVDTASYSPLYNGGTYYYEYTWIVNGVESPASPASTVYTYDLATDFKRLTITLANGPAGTTAKRIYRRRSNYGDTGYNLVYVINDNTTTAFDDLISDFAVTPSQPPVGSVPRYAIGLWMGEQASLDDWNDTFNALHAGFMSYDGAYDIWVDKSRSASAVTFDESNIIGEPEIYTEGLARRWSKVTYWYTDSEAGFKNARATVESANVALPANENEREEKVEADYRTFGVPSYDQAMRLAKLEYNRSRRTQRIRFLTNAKGVRVMPGLVVSVTHSVGPLVATLVTVLSVTPMAGGSTYQIDGAFYSGADYSDAVQSNPAPIIPGSPNPFLTPLNPTGLTVSETLTVGPDGSGTSKLKIDWTNASSPWFRATRVSVNDGLNTVELGDFPSGPAYFDSPRYGVLHTITAKTVTITRQVSTGTTATITPSLGGTFISPPGRAFDIGDGTTYWDEPPYLVFSPQYGSSYWTNSGFVSYDGTRVNDGLFVNQAFTLNVGTVATLSLDLGTGNTKDFRGIRVTTDTSFVAGEFFTVRYSDDGIGWTGVSGAGALINGHGFTNDRKHFCRTWDGLVGTHRYWQLYRDGAASTVGVVEVQFFELGTPTSDIRVDHYEVWDTFGATPRMMTTVDAASRPTSTQPFSLMEFVQPNANTMQVAVTAVAASGIKSARYSSQITAPSATSAGYLRVQTSSPTRQTGYASISGSSRAGDLIAQDGSNNEVAKIDGAAANTAAAPIITLSADADTGLFHPATNELALSTAGAERVRFGATGNIGIGTTTPNRLGFAAADRIVTIETPTTAGEGVLELIGKDVGTANFAAQASFGHHSSTSFYELAYILAKTDGANDAGLLEFGTVGTGAAYTVPLTMYSNGTSRFTGRIARARAGLTLANGDNNNVALPATGFVKIAGPTAAFAITGVVAGGDGDELILWNSTAQTMTIKHENANSTAANRITIPGAADTVVRAGTLAYDTASSRWILIQWV